MNKYLSTAGLFIKTTIYKILLLELLVIGVGILPIWYLAPYRFRGHLLGVLFLIPYLIASVVMTCGLTAGKSNTQYLLRRLCISEVEFMVVTGAAAFFEYLAVWGLQAVIVYGQVFIHGLFAGSGMSAKSMAVQINDNFLFVKLLPIERIDLIVENVLYFLLLAVMIGIHNGNKIREYMSLIWVLELGILILYCTANGRNMFGNIILWLLGAVVIDVLLILEYRKGLKDDREDV